MSTDGDTGWMWAETKIVSAIVKGHVVIVLGRVAKHTKLVEDKVFNVGVRKVETTVDEVIVFDSKHAVHPWNVVMRTPHRTPLGRDEMALGVDTNVTIRLFLDKLRFPLHAERDAAEVLVKTTGRSWRWFHQTGHG